MHVVLALFRKHSEFAFGDNLRYLAHGTVSDSQTEVMLHLRSLRYTIL